jgi:hypothetical protein
VFTTIKGETLGGGPLADHSGALTEVPKDHVEDEKDPNAVVEVDAPHLEGELPLDVLASMPPKEEVDPEVMKAAAVQPHADGEVAKDELPPAKEEVDPATLKEASAKVVKAEKVESEEEAEAKEEAKKEEKDKDIEPAATFLSTKASEEVDLKEVLAQKEKSENKKKVSPMRTK